MRQVVREKRAPPPSAVSWDERLRHPIIALKRRAPRSEAYGSALRRTLALARRGSAGARRFSGFSLAV